MKLRTSKGFHFLRALETFLLVAESGSMTEAARIMNMSQSAVSQQVIHLEQVLGAELLDRTLRPLKVTHVGDVLKQHAERLLLETERVLTMMQRSNLAPLPRLRLSVPSSLSAQLIPPIILELKDQVAIRAVSVWAGLASEQRYALLNREVDIIITSSALDDVDGLQRHTLVREPFILLLPKSHEGVTPSLKMLAAALPLVRYSARTDIGIQIERHLRRLRLDISEWIEFDAADSIVATVAAGHAWAISTPLHFQYGLRNGYQIHTARLPGPELSRTTHIVARTGEFTKVIERMFRICQHELKEQILPDLISADAVGRAVAENWR